MLKELKKYCKNIIKKNKYYWKYRHIFQKDVWDVYLNDSNSKRRSFLTNVITKYNFKSAFEFGCASGPNYFRNKNKLKFYFGYDISLSAIKKANEFKTNSNRIMFSSKLKKIYQYTYENDLKNFDIAIYDRVLYLLNDSQVKDHFNEFEKFFNYILIDDFYSEKEEIYSEGYIYTKNFIKLLPNFNLIHFQKTKHKSPDGFHDKFAKILLFKRINKQK